MTLSEFGALLVAYVAVSLAAAAALRRVQDSKLFERHPALGIVSIVGITVFSFLGIVIYEHIPFLPKSIDMKRRIAARRLTRRTWGAVDYQLAWDNRVLHGPHGKVTVYLVCRRDSGVVALKSRTAEFSAFLTAESKRRSLPAGSIAFGGVVSREEIKRGGGDFHFWRDYDA